MNQNRKEELLTRWLDGALSDEELRELEPVLAEHPELSREREEYGKLREDLQAAIPAEVEPPYPDFFNVHLERLVQGASRSAGRDKERRSLGRLWTWWMAPAATAALVAAFILGMNMTNPNVPDPISEVATAYSPVAKVESEIHQDNSLDATVIVVTGLDDVPDDNLIGWSGSQAEAQGVFISTSLTY